MIPVAPVADPQPQRVGVWMVGIVSDPANDPVLRAIEGGTFRFPATGTDANGVTWTPVTPDASGSLGQYPQARVYAAARVILPEGRRILARAERAFELYANGVPQPADIYGSRRMRVPLRTRVGENLIVLQGLGGRGPIEVELFSTSDEIVLNLADLTAPDPVAGDASELHLGVPVLNLSGAPVLDVTACVESTEEFERSCVTRPSLPEGAVTQVGFVLAPRAPFADPDRPVPVRLHLESPSLAFAYQRTVELKTAGAGAVFRRTFVSADDGSVQYYAVRPPVPFDPTRRYALVLSLHGAGVEAKGQADAYSPKDWAYVVAPTNRRPFGFDWEEWGHANGILALDDAMASLPIDPTRVYLTGHSMGGHGAWHLAVMHPGRFATTGPSAGWGSFYSYTGARRPTGPFGRARAHSDTLVYLSNLERRGAYVIHGERDDNVPVTEGRAMAAAAAQVTADVVYHEQPGAGHWWDGNAAPGADCVDWPPLFDFMKGRALDPWETDFEFKSPSPAYSATHSFITLHSAKTPYRDLVVTSKRSGDRVDLTTQNVRSLEIDGRALRRRGIASIVVDGRAVELRDGTLGVGPAEGKRRSVGGPFNQVFHRPFCLIYPDSGGAYAAYAAYLTSYWALYGNGSACALPRSRLTGALRDRYNLVYLGLRAEEIGNPSVPFDWSTGEVRFAGAPYPGAALLFVFPQRGHLSAALVAPPGAERLLYAIVPFSSRAGLPDYLLWAAGGGLAAGFFDAEWRYDRTLGVP